MTVVYVDAVSPERRSILRTVFWLTSCRKHLQGRYEATWKREFKLPWREADPPNHLDDKVDPDQ